MGNLKYVFVVIVLGVCAWLVIEFDLINKGNEAFAAVKQKWDSYFEEPVELEPDTPEPRETGVPVSHIDRKFVESFGRDYPIDMVLDNANGGRVEAIVVGRTSNDVVFFRKSDMKQFQIPIADLSLSDAEFIKSLSKPKYIFDHYALNKMEKMKRLKQEIYEKQAEINNYSTRDSLRRKLRNEVELAEGEILEIVEDIKKWKADNRID